MRSSTPYATIASLVIVAGFLVTTATNYLASASSAKEAIITNALPLTSDNVYTEIQRDFLQPVFVSSLMASDTFLRDWLLDGESDEGKIRRYLKEIKDRYNAVTAFLVSDATGNYYHYSGILKKVSPSEPRDAWYYRVSGMKSAYEINVDPDLANRDSMTIFINYKVFDYDGRYLGATGVGLEVGAVKEMVERYRQRYGRAVYFTDREGKVLLHAENADVPESLAQRPALASKFPQVLAGASTIIEFEDRGDTILLSARYIPELNWVLVIEQSTANLLDSFRRTLWTSAGICALVLLLVLYFHNRVTGFYVARLKTIALEDTLTGMPNRRAFSLYFEQTLKDAARTPTGLTLLLLDLDNFKAVNDRFGHNAGDELLRQAAQLIRARVRNSDLICRWGGEEFLVMLKGAELTDALAVAEEVRSAFALNAFMAGGHQLTLTTSIGVATHEPGDSESALVARADSALYKAKEKGRNRVETYSAEPLS